MCQQLDYLMDNRMFLMAVKLMNGSELSGISCQVRGQARGRICNGGASKKCAGFFIRNLVNLVNLVPEECGQGIPA
jgi:hypothetical protein